MTAEELKELVKRRPYVPVRLHLKNGDAVDILFPQLTLISSRQVVVGYKDPRDPRNIARDGQYIGMEYIERYEFVPGAQETLKTYYLILDWRKKRPFEPFRVVLDSGGHVEFRQPDRATVHGTELDMFPNPNPTPDVACFGIALSRVARIEPIPPEPTIVTTDRPS